MLTMGMEGKCTALLPLSIGESKCQHRVPRKASSVPTSRLAENSARTSQNLELGARCAQEIMHPPQLGLREEALVSQLIKNDPVHLSYSWRCAGGVQKKVTEHSHKRKILVYCVA